MCWNRVTFACRSARTASEAEEKRKNASVKWCGGARRRRRRARHVRHGSAAKSDSARNAPMIRSFCWSNMALSSKPVMPAVAPAVCAARGWVSATVRQRRLCAHKRRAYHKLGQISHCRARARRVSAGDGGPVQGQRKTRGNILGAKRKLLKKKRPPAHVDDDRPPQLAQLRTKSRILATLASTSSTELLGSSTTTSGRYESRAWSSSTCRISASTFSVILCAA